MNSKQEKYHEQIELYFRGELSETERVEFEKSLSNNTELKQEFDIHNELFFHFDKPDITNLKNINSEDLKIIKSYYKSKDSKKLKSVIERVNENYKRKESAKNRRIIYSVLSAAAIFIFIIIFYKLSLPNSQDLFVIYYDKDDLPSITSRSEVNNLYEGQKLFEEGLYQESYQFFSEYSRKEKKAEIQIYAGVSALQLNNYSDAIGYFDELINSESIDESMGLWFKSLTYIKMGDIKKARSILNEIIEDKSNFNYHKAKDLLVDIE